MRYLKLAALALIMTGCRPEPEAVKPPRFPLRYMQSRFYFDLGPETIDVSQYPEAQKEGYNAFGAVCGQCHTLSRPINAPVIDRTDWERYLLRMHQKTLIFDWWTRFGKEDAEKVLDFLAYDSKVRKVEDKKSFDESTEKLKALFEEVKLEKTRYQAEVDKTLVKEGAPYVGVK